jgi:predicted methyltransferase
MNALADSRTTHPPQAHRRRLCGALLLVPGWGAAAWSVDAHAGPASSAAATEDALLSTVLQGPQRSAANRARDAARHPHDTLRFFGLQPSHTVVEVAPGGGWYTEILAPYLRERGQLHAAHYAKDAASEYQRKSRAAFDARLAADPAVFDRVRVGAQPAAGHGFMGIAPPGGADLVLTFRNVHNWIEAGHLEGSLRAFFEVLRPGGVLGVEEHRAQPGAPLAQIIKTGYVPQDWLVAQARAVGFEFGGSSEVNANPKDTKDHPHGVWSLPPSLRGGNVDRARFLAIGESDRMTLRLVKPRP